MISNIAPIATSALQHASKSLAVSASNVANQFSQGASTQSAENGKAYVARRAEGVSNAEGGVQTKINEKTLGGVDPAEEIITQKFASYQFDASLKVLEVADELAGSLLDIEA